MDTGLIVPRTLWEVTCLRDGEIVWTEEYANSVTDQGVNDLLMQYFKGAGYTASWYIGLVNSGQTFSANDTAASHAGWTENINYNGGTRPALVLGPIGNKTANNSANKATFTMNGGGGNISGTFLSTGSGKGSTSGILYATATFLSGNKNLIANDVLTVTCTVTGAGA